MDILIRNCRALLYDKGIFSVKRTDIMIRDDRIAAIYPACDGCEKQRDNCDGGVADISDIESHAKLEMECVSPEAMVGFDLASFKPDRIINGTNKLVIPGLINSHTHAYMTMFKCAADDVTFDKWLFDTIFPMEDGMKPGDAYVGTMLGIMEMLRTGTTCYLDMDIGSHENGQAMLESGIRGVLSRGLVGSEKDSESMRRVNDTLSDMKEFAGCSRITHMFAPHAPYTCKGNFLRYCGELADEYGVGINVHISESVTEIENMKKECGLTPIEYVESLGLLDRHVVAAHCVQLSGNDVQILKKHDVSVATNPQSNMKLGNGFAPVPELDAAGINVCLGTDSTASNNSLNMFTEMKALCLVNQGLRRDSTALPAQKALQFATVNGAKALSLPDIGMIAAGRKADLAIINMDNPTMRPCINPISSLVYAANGSEVETVIVDGKILMENREFKTIDEEKVYFDIDRIAKRYGVYHK